MNVLVVGGAGFVGANMVRRCLAEDGCQVTVLDSLDGHFRSSIASLKTVWDQIRFVRGDLRDETLLAEVVQEQDVIFNCAAQTSHPLSMQFPLLDAEINCLGNLKLLEAVRLLNPAATVVYVSSSTVTGRARQPVVDESHPEQPLEIYSANKGVAEKYHHIYHSMHGLRTVVIRLANIFGPYGKGFAEFGFINYFIDQAWKQQAIRIFGSGAQTRNVLYVDDATELLWQAAQAPLLVGQTFLGTSEEHRSVWEIAQEITRTLGRGTVEQMPWPEERRRMEVDAVRYSSQRLQQLIPWRPADDLASGLCKVKAHLEQAEAGT